MIYKKKKLTIKLLSHAFYEMSKKRLERLEEAEGGSKKLQQFLLLLGHVTLILNSSLQFRLLFRGRYQSLELHARITLFVLQYKIQILILVLLFGRQQCVPALTTTLCIGNSAEICSKINAMSLLLVLHCKQMLFKMKMKLNQGHRTCKLILSVQIK